MTILILDGYNLFHRARSGYTAGEHAVTYNFFRGFRALVEKFNPSRVFVTLEGHPKERFALLPEYKANRKVEEGTKKHDELKKFHVQKDEIIDLLVRHFPVSVVRHPDFEGDDVVYNLIRKSPTSTDFVVVSSDTDFTQLLNHYDNVRIYNPIQKKFVEWDKKINYVVFKALKGDDSDNIPGIPGVGEKTAAHLAHDDNYDELGKFTLSQSDVGESIIRNERLIRLAPWDDEEAKLMTSSQPTESWDTVKAQFDEWAFKSITKEPSWTKFVATFDHLFG